MNRLKIRVQWNWDNHLEYLSELLDKIDENTLLEVYIEKYSVSSKQNSFLSNNSLFFKYYKTLKTTKKLENFRLENEKIVEICQKLFTKNIFDLRINTPIDDDMLVEMIASFLSSTNDGKQRNYK